MVSSEKELEIQYPQEDDIGQHNGETMELNRAQEQRVLSKFDKYVMPQMAILVLFAYLDRTNIGNYPRAPPRLMYR